jgi:hypothetical protein
MRRGVAIFVGLACASLSHAAYDVASARPEIRFFIESDRFRALLGPMVAGAANRGEHLEVAGAGHSVIRGVHYISVELQRGPSSGCAAGLPGAFAGRIVGSVDVTPAGFEIRSLYLEPPIGVP